MKENFFFEITSSTINILSAIEFVSDDSYGATSIFLGKVRNTNNDRKVIGITYDVHENLAIKSFAKIYTDLIKLLKNPCRIYISHFKGYLPVNDVSVLVAVSTLHRDEAFKACRFIIDAIKHNTPIWKQEHYIDGDNTWLQGHTLFL